MKRWAAIVILTLVAFATVNVISAAASDCTGATCVYLPLAVTRSPATILPNHSSFVTRNGLLHIVGEIQNTGATNLQAIKIVAHILDNRQQIVATEDAYLVLDTLPAGDKTCFDIALKEPARWASYQFETPRSRDGTDSWPTLTVLETRGALQPNGYYQIAGQIRNDHANRITYIQPIATLYDAAGTVLDCNYALASHTELQPGQTTRFSIDFAEHRRSYADVGPYRLQIDGDVQ